MQNTLVNEPVDARPYSNQRRNARRSRNLVGTSLIRCRHRCRLPRPGVLSALNRPLAHPQHQLPPPQQDYPPHSWGQPPIPHTHSPLRPSYGFGILIVRLTIAHPHPTKTATAGCTSHGRPSPSTPSGTCCSVQPFHTHAAIQAATHSDVGMGVPSK